VTSANLGSSREPGISVVIPLYNKEKYVRRAVESVLSQTFRDFELIVVNDGSTDNSPALVRSYDDPRIRVINQENQGVSAARNRGITEARGKLIAFLDADDKWLPDFLDIVIHLVKKFPDAGAYATGIRLVRQKKGISRDLYVRGGQDQCGCYFDLLRKGMVANSSNITIRQSVFEKSGVFRDGFRRGEDLDMWFRIGLYYKFACSARICALYYCDMTDGARHTVTPVGVPPLYISFSEMKTDTQIDCSVRFKATQYMASKCSRIVQSFFLTGSCEVGRQRLAEYRQFFGVNAPYIKMRLLSMIPSLAFRFVAAVIRCMLTLQYVIHKWMSGNPSQERI